MSSKRSEGNTDSSIEYKYDSAGNLIEISNPLKKEDNKVLENTYDDYFRLKTQTKDNGTTYYTYNWENMPLSITTKDNSGKVLSEENYTYEYNNQGLLTTKTVVGDNTSESIVTKVQTDLIGRTIWEDNSDRPDRMRTQYTYDYMNNVTTKKVFSGSTLKLTYLYDYDHAGNILKETLQGQTNALYTYDMLGNMLSSTDANGNTTTYDYSGDGLLLKKTTPIDESTTGEIQYNYDNAGNVIEEKVKTGNNKYRSTTYTYDFNNNLATTTQGNTLISYTYNALGNVLTMKLSDTRNLTPERTTSYVYDNMGNCVRITDPMGNSEFYKYNSCNDVIEKTDRNGNKTNYTYDGLHRVIKVSVTKDGVTQVINKEYGATGGLTKEYDGTSTKSYAYNSLGLVKTDTTTAANSTYTLNKTYDYMGNVSLIDYGVYKVKYDYDERGRLTRVSDWNSSTGKSTKLEEYQYDKNNNVLKKLSYTGAPDVTYTYNKSDMLTSLRQGSLASYDYTYNPDGNVYTVKDNNNNLLTVYNYNNNGQLIRELKRDSEKKLNICYTDYDYDAAGNRIYENFASNDGDYEIDYTYDKNNRLIKERQYSDVQENNRVTSYRYDKNGNRIGKSYYNNYPNTSPKITLKIEDYRSDLTTDAETYTYDGFNRLTQISTEGDNVYKYAYYPNGLRMYKDVNGAMTYFQWDGDNIWGLAANVSNGLTHYYYRGLDGVIKENYGAVYVYNGHGDVVKVTNSNGDVTKDYEYNAFGVIEDENAADINPWRYCGEYYDTETDNVYLRARYYDPSIGSFITEDPARDGVNWYSYCAGNPVSYIDPSGYAYIYMDVGRNIFSKDYGKVRGYYLVPETLLSASYKAVAGTLPGGDYIIWSTEKAIGITGGISSSDFGENILDSIKDYSKNTLMTEILGSDFTKLLDLVDYGNNIESSIATVGMVSIDKVAFDIMDKFGIETYSSSQSTLENNIEIVYNLISMTDYRNYFFKPSFGKTTVFEMDYEIYSSKNSNAVKQKYINMVLNMAKNTNISSDTIDSIINDINNYGKRIEDIKNWLSGTTKK